MDALELGSSISRARKLLGVTQADLAELVGVSALLTTTMPGMARVVSALKEAGLSGVKVIVGGAPLSEGFASEIGADAYGYDAAHAVELARAMLA